MLLKNAIFLVLITGLLVSCADAASITRSVDLNPDSTATVTISIPEGSIGGLAETLPSGYSFVSSAFPESRLRVSGDKILFAVINDTTIEYCVKYENPGEISGIWHDAKSGEITSFDSGQGINNKQKSGITGIISILGIAAVCIILQKKRGF
jgi:hypothetical protein